MSIKVTKTINRLPFKELNPMRFEDLCLNIVSRMTKWKEVNHFGRAGNDGGVDIHSIELINDIEKVWFIQCKRYLKITKTDLNSVVNEATKKNTPNKLLLIVSCDLSRELYNHFKSYALEKNIKESEIWTASTLESRLYSDYKDLLFVYFDIKIENKKISNETKVRYSLKMGKKMRKDFINHAYFKENFYKVLHNPRLQFISSRVIIHSIDDTEYPTCGENVYSWYREHLYDFYHNGIELWLGASLGYNAIIDKNGYWEPIGCLDERENRRNYKTIKVKMIGRIPFYNIVDYKVDGDEYYSEPHIYCKFDINGEPFEKIYYKSYGNPDERISDMELDEAMKTTFSKT